MTTITHEFTGTKPTKSMIVKKAIALKLAGYRSFGLAWGENQMDFHSAGNNKLHGYGWIKNVSGSDIADFINSN